MKTVLKEMFTGEDVILDAFVAFCVWVYIRAAYVLGKCRPFED